MKVAIMALLVTTIIALSHLPVTPRSTQHVAVEIPSYGRADILRHSAKRAQMMWISIFAIAIVAAIFFGVAAFRMQPIEVI